MFKRMQKLNAKLEKGRARGDVDEEAGPPEMALDDDSSSGESSSSSDENASSSGHSSDGESEASNAGTSKSKNGEQKESLKRKRKTGDDESEEEDSDGDDESDDSESSSKASSSASPTSPEDDRILRPSVAEAIREPIYIPPRAASKKGFKHRCCYLCPQALLKTEKMIETHLAGGSHSRRLKRFVTYTEKKLKPEQKQDPREGGRDAPSVVAEIDKSIEKRGQAAKEHKARIRLQKREAKHKRIVAKKAAKTALKEAKAAARQQAADATIAGAGKKKKEKKQAASNGVEQSIDPSAQITEHAVLDTTSTAVVPKPKTPVRIRKREPLPPKAERKARRKEKNVLRQTRKYEERKAKRERKAQKGAEGVHAKVTAAASG